MHTNNLPAVMFDPKEARVIACLLEKQLTTPNNYPLSLNSLVLACNQKTNRVPVMDLTAGQVGHVVNQLESRKLVGVDCGGRATHVSHRLMTVFDINRKQQAILAVLMVREPLTLNDIKTKTGRMEDFSGVDEVLSVVESLINRDEPLVIRLAKAPGSREERFTHLLCGEVTVETTLAQAKSTSTSSSISADRLDELELRLEQLEAKVEALTALTDNR